MVDDKLAEKKKKRPWWARPDHEMIGNRVDHFKKALEDSRISVDEEDRDEIAREAARRDPDILNLLDMKIKKKKGPEREGDFLVVPVYGSQTGEKIARALRLKTKRRIRLDDYGWTVWNNIDGNNQVRDIGKRLKERFGEDVEPLYPRLSKFLSYLRTLDLIRIENPSKKD